MTSSELPVRLVARLDIKASNVIKGVHLEGLRVVGKPENLSRKYYDAGIDEMVFMDAVASLYGRNSLLPIIEDAARDIFVPITVGGGIRSLDDIGSILRSGADKVAINTAAVARPSFLKEAAEAFGSQCIVLSIEAMRWEAGRWEVVTDNGRERSGRHVVEWAQEAESLGIGEILLTSVNAEGERKGFDIPLIKAVRNAVQVPVVASGGAGNAEHVATLLKETEVEAVACASIFHYDVLSVGDLKSALAAEGLRVRQ